MKKRDLQDNNEGFSLIELIIVITIIMVFSAASFISVSLINNGRAKDAATSVNSELAACNSKAKNEKCVVPDDVEDESGTAMIAGADTVEVVSDACRYAVKIYKDSDGKYYIQNGYYYTDDSGNSKYIYSKSENKSGGKGRNLTSGIIINFEDPEAPDDSDKSFEISGTKVKYIVFRKDGSCSEGYGSYEFAKKGGYVLTTINVNKNGSRQSN